MHDHAGCRCGEVMAYSTESGLAIRFEASKDFKAHDVAVTVVIQDNPRLVLIAFRDGSVA
jgi:hypothetical protein